MLVIGPNGEQLGVKMRREALEIAYEYEMDLFCVAPQGNPPVCKILDYGKYRFELQKKTKEAKIYRINSWSFGIILTEGKNRQIRRMVASVDKEVKKLKKYDKSD